MIIYSWNMLFENSKQDEALAFINDSSFDIFCLQEVPHHFFLKLQSLPNYISHVEESIVVSRHRKFPIYSVILSKHKIIHRGEILFDTVERTFRVMFTRFLINFFNKEKVIAIQDHKAMFVDIQVNGKALRIFNLHLSLTYPQRRMEELKQVLQSYIKGGSIFCGDFNVVESLHISVINWLLGGTLSEWIFYRTERIKMEELFAHFDIVNSLRHRLTHPISLSQLDHILTPRGIIINEARVIRKRLGSDHCPIMVNIKM